ncbi:BnaA07g01190D [Brassica napus]|uniref:BnaA07g01190D protein n=3 Tax=Brassica TaxID=3705 RepID=A0A078E2S1_BRANA|nr:BnaA07g01190D [Brassica napus]
MRMRRLLGLSAQQL